MSLGLGIFLSTLLICLVLLHRWGYLRKILKFGLALVALAAGGGAAFWGYSYYQDRPTKQLGYLDLKLGMTMDEVQYVKGQPGAVLVEEPPDSKWKGHLAVYTLDDLKDHEKKEVIDYFYWQYDFESPRYRVDVIFSPTTKTVTEIGCYAELWDAFYNTCGVLGLAAGSDEEQIYGRLGKPAREKLEGFVKTVEYPDFNLKFKLKKNKAYYITVKSPSKY